MKKSVKIFLLVVCLLILGAIFLPVYYGETCRLIPEKSCRGGWVNLTKYIQYQKNRNLQQSLEGSIPLLPRFPEFIGGYKLDVSDYGTRTECSQLRGEDVCLNIARARYKKDSTDEITDLDFIRIINGKEIMLENKGKYFTAEELDGIKAGWSGDGAHFTWFPQNNVDIIVVNEGSLKFNPEEKYFQYTDKTTGTSLVTLYFLEKYPPVQ